MIKIVLKLGIRGNFFFFEDNFFRLEKLFLEEERFFFVFNFRVVLVLLLVFNFLWEYLNDM